MKQFNATDAARQAVAAHPDRPATAITYDAADARLVVFHLLPGQVVKPHRSSSTVIITVLDGRGLITGEAGHAAVEHSCTRGDTIVFAPQELHGMQATDEALLLLATIAPRPGGS